MSGRQRWRRPGPGVAGFLTPGLTLALTPWLTLGLILTLGFSGGVATAAPPEAEPAASLEELLREVLEQGGEEERLRQEREQDFLAARDRRRALLEALREDIQEAKAHTSELQDRKNENLDELARLQTELEQQSGNLRQLGGVVRRVAGDTHAALRDSLVSAEHPEREDLAERLVVTEGLPAYGELRRLWTILLEEMVESGQSSRFRARVSGPDGLSRNREVLRVGAFNVVSGGLFLRYQPETRSFLEPARQPPAALQRQALELEKAPPGADLHLFPLDPTRGSVLSLLVERPNLVERIHQGGVVGYVIIALGGLCLLLAAERWLLLALTGHRMRRQQGNAAAVADNPMGRLLRAAAAGAGDLEALQHRLDEAVLREIPALQRGLGALALIASVAPLLGLLGTVVGIIETFQAITLFGTGDPRVMSGGISEALVTTVLGLVVAIPTLFIHGALLARSRRLLHALDQKAAGLTAAAAMASTA